MKFLYPFKPTWDFKTNKQNNPNPFSFKICFLHGVLLLTLEMLRVLWKLDSAAFGQLSGKGEGRKGTALGRLRSGIQQVKRSDSNTRNINALGATVLSICYQAVLVSRETLFVLVIH